MFVGVGFGFKSRVSYLLRIAFGITLSLRLAQAAAPNQCQALLLTEKWEQTRGGTIVLDPTQPAIVQGSLGKTRGVGTTGGIQPDYWISVPNDPHLRSFLEAVRNEAQKMPAPTNSMDHIAMVQGLINTRMPEKSPVAPAYLKLLQEYTQQNKLIPLGEYLRIGSGVCREFALLTHLALRALGEKVSYAYLQHIFQGKVEDHAINLIDLHGQATVIDFYYGNYHLKPLQALLDSHSVLRINPYPQVWQNEKRTNISATFVERFKSSPIETEKQIRSRWWEAKQAAPPDVSPPYDDLSFSMPELKVVVDRAVRELQSRSLLTPALADQADKIARDAYPYRAVHAFVREWVEIMEPLARKKYLESEQGGWVSDYFKRSFSQFYDSLVLRATEGLAFPWFTPPDETVVDMDFFIRTRGTRLYLLGLRTEVTRTDGDPLGPSDFFYHDLEHLYRQKTQTDLVIRDLERPERAALQALWDRRVQNLLVERDRLGRQNPALGEAMTYLLFELLHERGFAPDYQSLRDQTLSDRWTKVIVRKLQNRFWFPEVKLSPDFDTLEQARRHLLIFIDHQSLAEADWLRNHLNSSYSHTKTLAATVRIQKPAQSSVGRITSLTLEGPEDIQVGIEIRPGAKIKYFPEPLIGLEQVLFPMPRRFTAEVGLFYSHALRLKKGGQVKGIRVNAQSGLPEVLLPNGQWQLLTAFSTVPANTPALSGHTLYRLEQLFSLWQTKALVDALVLRKPVIHRGILSFARGPTRNYRLGITLPTGEELRFSPQEAQVIVPDGL